MPYKDKEKQRAYQCKWYQKNKKKHVNAHAAARKERRAWVNKIKNVPCMDCHGRFPTYVMDFDHVRGKKEGIIAKAIDDNWAWKRLEKEIKKCELVCANCHRIRHMGV